MEGMTYTWPPTSPSQFAVLAIAGLTGLFSLGVICLVMAVRANANDAETAWQLAKLGCVFIGLSLGGWGILLVVRRWLD
jgi:hypothetical protein